MMTDSSELTPLAAESFLTEAVRWACLLEATARKPGNVHPEASFDDLDFDDFVKSANVVAPLLAKSSLFGIGLTIESSVMATQAKVGKNTNLGIILLLAPLAAVPLEVPLDVGIEEILNKLTVEDAKRAYWAINSANAGGMGEVSEQDLSQSPTVTLKEAMALASDRDQIAAQYADGFGLVWSVGIPFLLQRKKAFRDNWEQVVLELFLTILAEYPDSLIARKCGLDKANEASRKAKEVLESGWPEQVSGKSNLEQFDAWLREEGHRRNPGTTADLVAACLFAAFIEQHLAPPQFQQLQQFKSKP